jgi:hypothetical protein
MWQLDVADNDLTGPLPALSGLAGLEMLVVNNNPRLGGALPGELQAEVACNLIAYCVQCGGGGALVGLSCGIY